MAKKRAAATLPPPPGEIIADDVNGLRMRRIKVSEIDGAHYNPREITEAGLEGLGNSIGKFKLVQPLVWNLRFRRLVGGHQRLRTLDPKSSTDVVEVDLDELDEKALNAALNNRAIQGEFNSGVNALVAEIRAARPDLSDALMLEAVKVNVPEARSLDVPDEFPTVDETTATTEHNCPRCGYQF